MARVLLAVLLVAAALDRATAAAPEAACDRVIAGIRFTTTAANTVCTITLVDGDLSSTSDPFRYRTQGTQTANVAVGFCIPYCTGLAVSFSCTAPSGTKVTGSSSIPASAIFGDCTTGQGDPLLQGFDGRMFDFFGKPDKVFCLLSERDHALNVKMVAADLANHTGGGTFMQALGLVYKDHTVEANITEDGAMTVTVDGVPTAPGNRAYVEWLDGEATVEAEPHFPELGHIVVVSTPLLVMRIQAVQPVTNPETGFSRGHLDFAVSLLSRPRAMHGVLGQTAYNPERRYSLSDMAFHGEGEEADYGVPSILSTADFKFNLFDPVPQTTSGVGRTVLLHAEHERFAEPQVAGKFVNRGLAHM